MMKRPFTKYSYFLIVLICSCAAYKVSAQNNNCEILTTLQVKNLKEARTFIFKTLNTNPSQSNCFFKKALEVYDSAALNLPLAKDTIFKLFNIWYAIKNDCEVFNEEAKRIFLYKKEEKEFRQDFCPHLKNGFLTCYNYSFDPIAVLSLEKCLSTPNYNYDAEKERYTCKIEEFVWNYIENHPELVSKAEWRNLKLKSENALLGCPFISCNKLDSLFLPGLENRDLSQIKKFNSILSQKQCTESKLYRSTTSIILDKEPSFNGLYQSAIQCRKTGLLAESYTFFAKAEKLTSVKPQKALCYLGIAELLEQQEKYEKAKEFAQIAIDSDPNNQESFVFLAHLFQKAETFCGMNDQIELAALHLLISRYYKLAGMNTEAEKHTKLSNIDILLTQRKVSPTQKQKLECFIKEEVELKK